MNLAKLLTPTNLATEKEKFFQSRNYHPQFLYPTFSDEEIQRWRLKKPHLVELKSAIENKLDDAITEIAQRIFGTKIYAEVLEYALAVTGNRPKHIPSRSVDSIAASFDKAFSFLSLEYKLVIADEHG